MTYREEPLGTSVSSTTPEIVLFPRNDRAFRAHVEWAVERLAERNPEELEESVKAAYPQIRVRERIPLADLGGRHAWYVYRDGSLSAADEQDWSATSEVAEFDIDATGTYVGANAAAASLVDMPVEEIIGRSVGSFTRHERDDGPGRRAFAVLAEEGYLESTAVVVRPDGSEVAVRYRLTGTPARGYRMAMAPRQDHERQTEATRRRDEYTALVEQAGDAYPEDDDPRAGVADTRSLPGATGSA